MSGAGSSAGGQHSGGLLSRSETRALGAFTQYADDAAPCPGCGREMGPEERFCAGCGKLRQGLNPEKVVRVGESRTEAAWREVQERLANATSGRFEIVR